MKVTKDQRCQTSSARLRNQVKSGARFLSWQLLWVSVHELNAKFGFLGGIPWCTSVLTVVRFRSRTTENTELHKEKPQRQKKRADRSAPFLLSDYSAVSSSVSPSVRMSSSARSASSYACETSSCTLAAASSISGERRTLR